MPAILFDLDGTLHDRASGIIAYASDQFCRLAVDSAQLHHYVTRFQELDCNGKVWKSEVYSQLIKEFELKGNPTVGTLVAEYIQLYPSFAVEFADAKYVLKTLKERQITIGILTNGRSDVQRSVIASLGFDAFVSTIIVSAEVGFSKPQHEIFDIALKQLGTKACETILVGDDPVADIEGAITAGIHPIAFNCCKAFDGVVSVCTMKDALDAISTSLELWTSKKSI